MCAAPEAVVYRDSAAPVEPPGPPAAGSAAARVAAAGESWRTRFEPDVMVARLRAAGFRSVSLLYAGDATERYLRDRTDGLRAPARGVIADATL